MSFKSTIISKILKERSTRESYVRAKLNQLIPSQIKALRLRSVWTQADLGMEADMKQARISAAEKPGEVNFNLETLVRLAAAFRVGLQVRFVPYSEMLDWENNFSQDLFSVLKVEEDSSFLSMGVNGEQGLTHQGSEIANRNTLKIAPALNNNAFKQANGPVINRAASVGRKSLWQ